MAWIRMSGNANTSEDVVWENGNTYKELVYPTESEWTTNYVTKPTVSDNLMSLANRACFTLRTKIDCSLYSALYFIINGSQYTVDLSSYETSYTLCVFQTSGLKLGISSTSAISTNIAGGKVAEHFITTTSSTSGISKIALVRR